jgi:hypothetical protein
MLELFDHLVVLGAAEEVVHGDVDRARHLRPGPVG